MTPTPKDPKDGEATSAASEAKCPFFGVGSNNLPVGPIAQLRKMSRVKSISGGATLKNPGLLIPPNLPSRCTWDGKKDQKSPHCKDGRYYTYIDKDFHVDARFVVIKISQTLEIS
jgi:hypothetical protein